MVNLVDWSKLDIRGGVIHYKLYRQDGTMQEMTAPERFAGYVAWMQIHDRYTTSDETE